MLALGATRWQRASFHWSEVILIFVFASAAGIALGDGMAFMLVKLMTGVFDPPPESLAIPWFYMATLFATSAAFTIVTVAIMGDGRRIDIPAGLKDSVS